METYFQDEIKKIDALMPIMVESKQSVQLSEGVWNSETMTCTEYIPLTAPDSYKIYARLKASFINRIAIFEALHYGAIGVSTETYMKAMDAIKKNVEHLRDYYKTEPVSLLIIDRKANPAMKMELFSDIILCDDWLRRNHSLTVEQVQSHKLDKNYQGTFIQKQSWHTKEGTIFNEFPQVTDLYDKPKTDIQL